MNPAADRPRVVFDCNVLVQAISSEAGPAGQALALLQQNRIEVYVSGAVLKELRKVFQYPSVRAKFPDLDDQRIETFIKKLTFRAKLLREVRHVFDYPRATQDEPYIDLAAAAKANYLVSRDRDLLSLATDRTLIGKQFRQRYPHLRVLNPVAFLAMVAPKEGPTT
ncbi:MAG TPA: putative toxin-antitoxin system toxin component, PIN family [Tepidisphaeraceae bacterium]|nr:putative toxin-antitoxin system toxin component, PIN family [Tepidisphaeraceae bacterium]